MATVKTIKPAGGGDYTTLAAWWAWAKTQASAAQWAECYSGGNLGQLTMSGYTFTPDANNYVRIYAATGHKHDGTAAASGCATLTSTDSYQYILDVRPSFTRVEGIKFVGGGTNSVFIYAGYAATNLRIDGNLIVPDRTYGAGIRLILEAAGTMSADVWNNIIYGGGYTTANLAGINIVTDHASAISTVNLYNNTVDNVVASGGANIYLRVGYTGGTQTVTSKNNVSTRGSAKDFYKLRNAGTQTVTSSYCVSSDATGDDWGTTGSQVSQLPINCYEALGSNHKPLKCGSLFNRGVTITDFSADAIGTTRPQYRQWDVGALELVRGGDVLCGI